jgi:hypothetical protein
VTESSVALPPVGSTTMPQPDTSKPPLTPYERPKCEACGRKTILAHIEPYRVGYDLRTFECSYCHHTQTAVIRFG